MALLERITPLVYRALDAFERPWDHGQNMALAHAALRLAGRSGEAWPRAILDGLEVSGASLALWRPLAERLPAPEEPLPAKAAELTAGGLRRLAEEGAPLEPLLRHLEIRQSDRLPRAGPLRSTEGFLARALAAALLFGRRDDLRFANAGLKLVDSLRASALWRGLLTLPGEQLLALASAIACQEDALGALEEGGRDARRDPRAD